MGVLPQTPAPRTDALHRIHVVLVAPRSSGNVGAVVRGMANHGLGRLVLVDPPAFDPDVARWMAPRAHDRINKALFVATVAEAIDALDVVRVIGTSARARRLKTPVWGPAQLAEELLDTEGDTAIVFGPEDFGLDNASVARCDAVLRIPTTAHSSLNLAQAVQATASTLSTAARVETRLPVRPTASARLRQLLVADLVSVLEQTTYFVGRRRTPTRARIMAALSHLPIDHDAAATARGMLKSIRHRLLNPLRDPPDPLTGHSTAVEGPETSLEAPRPAGAGDTAIQ